MEKYPLPDIDFRLYEDGLHARGKYPHSLILNPVGNSFHISKLTSLMSNHLKVHRIQVLYKLFENVRKLVKC